MKKNLIVLLLLISTVLSFVSAGTISGTITNDFGSEENYYQIDLFEEYVSPITFRPIRTMVTDKDGNYSFDNVDVGKYIVKASHTLDLTISEFYEDAYIPEEATVVEITDSSTVLTVNMDVDITTSSSISGTINEELDQGQIYFLYLYGIDEATNTVMYKKDFASYDRNYTFDNIYPGKYILSVERSYTTTSGDIVYGYEFYRNSVYPRQAEIISIPDDHTNVTGIDFNLGVLDTANVGTGRISGVIDNNSFFYDFEVFIIEVFKADSLMNWNYAEPFTRVLSDPRSPYVVRNLPDGNYKIKARSIKTEGLYEFFDNVTIPELSTTLTIDSENQEYTDIDIVFDSEYPSQLGDGVIWGNVSDLSGDEKKLFYVDLYYADPNIDLNFNSPYRSIVTDLYGNYSIENVPDGNYIIRAKGNPGSDIFEFYDNTLDPNYATIITVDEENLIHSDIDFVLETGIVSFDGVLTGNLTKDGSPVAGAEITIHIPDVYIGGITYTDDNGFFIMEDLCASYYLMKIEADGFYDYYYNDAQSYDDAELINFVEDDDHNIHLDIDLSAYTYDNYTVSGTVLNQITGMPVSNAPMWIESVNHASRYYGTDTDDNGFYSFAVPPGDYRVFYNSNWGWDGTFEYWQQYYDNKSCPYQAKTLKVTSNIGNIDFDLIPYDLDSFGTISGHVDPSGSNFRYYIEVFDESAASASNIPEPLLISRVLPDGSYIINLPLGNYYVMATDELGYYNSQFYQSSITFDNATTVALAINGDFISDINFDLENILPTGYGRISGYVIKDSGIPVEGAQILVEPDQANYTVVMPYNSVTDENGYFNIESISRGNYRFSVQADGYNQYFYNNAESWETADIISVIESTDMTINVDLSPFSLDYHLISGTVRDADTGEPIEGAIVATDYISHDPSSADPEDGVAITDENGEWVMETYSGVHIFHSYAYTDSYYMLQFYDHENSPVNAERVLVNSDMNNIDFDLTKYNPGDTNTISGNITDESGDVPQYGVSLVAISSDEDWEETVPMEIDGSYEFRNLKEGYYYILALSAKSVPTYYQKYIDFESATPVPVGSTDIDIQLLNAKSLGYYSITGIISDGEMNPIENAMVYAVDSFGKVKGFTQSNAEGNYKIEQLTSGYYKVLATGIRHDTDIQNLTVYDHNTINFQLGISSSIGNEIIPEKISLEQNYPNPFNPVTKINFSIPHDSNVTLNVYNVNGQIVDQLVNSKLSQGYHSVNFNAAKLTTGIYLYRLTVDDKTAICKRMLLLK